MNVLEIVKRFFEIDRLKPVLPNPKDVQVTQEAALARAKQVVTERGETWREPIHINLIVDDESRRPAWSINTDILTIGMGIHVVIDARTGRVLYTHSTLR